MTTDHVLRRVESGFPKGRSRTAIANIIHLNRVSDILVLWRQITEIPTDHPGLACLVHLHPPRPSGAESLPCLRLDGLDGPAVQIINIIKQGVAS